MTAPVTPGTYYIGACVDSVTDESDVNNNCSTGVQITVTGRADLVVQSPSVSDTTPGTGQSFTAYATAHNQGDAASTDTTMRYYLSTNSVISTSDTQLATDYVSALTVGGTSAESATVTAPVTPGTYWIGSCVDSVSGEFITKNNCSIGVQIDVETPVNIGSNMAPIIMYLLN